MKVLYVKNEALWMPGIIFALNKMGHEILVYPESMEKFEDNEELQRQFAIVLKRENVDFVLTIWFSKEVARVTNRIGLKYATWCVDSPAFHAWVPEAEYDNCYLFYLDYQEYELKKKGGQSNAYYLPMAADIIWSGQLVITDDDIKQYACNMSFVGGMYTDNLYDRSIGMFPVDMQNAFTEIIEQSAFVWDNQDRLHISQELVETVRRECPQIFPSFDVSDEYYLKRYLLGRKLTQVERTLLMDLMAQQYDIHLYTRDKEIVSENVRRFPAINLLETTPKVYYSSKINLNITLRSIASGIPARVFDVMSVGGFMLSNWQAEIPEMFVEDQEIVTYKTPEELIDKANYYLKHEDRRIRISVNGYRKVKEQHTYEHRLDKIISILFPTPKHI